VSLLDAGPPQGQPWPAPPAVLVTDLGGVILEADARVGVLTGRASAWLAGKPLASLVAEGERRAFSAALDRVAAAEREDGLPVALTRRDGATVAATASVALERADGQRTLRWVLRAPLPARDAADALLDAHRPPAPEERSGASARELRIARSLVDLADGLDPGYHLLDALALLCERAVEVLGLTTGAAYLYETGRLRLVAVSSGALDVIRLFERGIAVAEATAGGQPWYETDLRRPTARWPGFARQAAEAGFGCVVALPLRRGQVPVGAVGLVGAGPARFAERDLLVAQALAEAAGVGVLQQRTAEGYGDLAEQLEHALAREAVVEQARGFLAARLDTDVEAALALLHREAWASGRPLRDLAAAVLDRTLDLTEDP
jgi:hypothetical protein